MQGYPQDWIYIERKVRGDLEGETREGVRAPINFVGKSLAEIFKKDIMDVNARKIAMIRPIIGANGAGKTTQMEIQIKKHVKDIFADKLIYLFFDFKFISNTKEAFWPVFIQKFYDQIQDNQYLRRLCAELPQEKLKSTLIKKFKNAKIVDQVLNSISSDASTQALAEEFFFGGEISSKDIMDFFNGFLSLALDLDKPVVFCLDELQFLIDIDPSETLATIILEQFIRKLLEQYRNNRLYIICSCLQNPDKQEYDALKEVSKNFKSIIEGKEIILGNLTAAEKDEILDQICEKVEMPAGERKKFLSQVKGRLEFFLPRYLLKSIAENLEIMGYTCYTPSELRNLYEKEAREFVAPKLREKGFGYIEEAPKRVGGYDIDIYANSETNRVNRVSQAFGEVTIRNRRGIKEKVEKFASWLHQMKGREYRPDLGDFVFFICPSNRLTKMSKETLESNDIQSFEFDSSFIDEINKIDQEEKIEVEPPPEIMHPQPITPIADNSEVPAIKPPEEKPIVGKKPHKFELKDIPGVGPAKIKLLKQANISTIEDLITCNPRLVAGKVSGLGERSLNTWIQKAKQILHD